MKRSLLAVFGLGVFAAGTAVAQDASQAASAQTTEDEVVKREEVIVVSASKVETTLVNAPATLTVIGADVLATSPAQNYGDLLRSVPGLNVVQTSARDVNMTARQGTSTLVNSQLVLLDGRSIYLDFFGLVLWDFVPQSPSEIKQIEVVRGPASSVWGANALTGVVNIITKSPREAEGFGLSLSGGLFGRDGGSREDEGSGTLYGANFSWADAPSEKFSYRLSAGYFDSDPYSRPVGRVPVSTHPLDASIVTGGAPYPADTSGRGTFSNAGTSQPKVDLRVDQEVASGGRLTYQGGWAGTSGIIHTGIGPFDIQEGSFMTYGKVNYSKGALKLNVFGNFVDADAPNLLNIDGDTGRPVLLSFKTQTYDFEVGHSTVLAGRHILSYGGNYRRNNFDITLAPNSEDRNELGAYVQEEFFVDKFRLAAGARVDKFGNIDGAVWSPRVSVMFKPSPSHSIRASFNRAFRSPSVINNFLLQPILSPTPIDLRPLRAALPQAAPLIPAEPFLLRVVSFGNTRLKEESISAYELAYTGSIGGKTTVGLAIYRNEQDDNINFTQLTQLALADALAGGLSFYSPANPARGLGLVSGGPIAFTPQGMALLASLPAPIGPIVFPEAVATYLNLGPIRNQGVEFSLEHSFNPRVSAFANYSYQDTPKILDEDPGQLRHPVAEVGVPATNRFNAGVNWNAKRFLGAVNVNYSDGTFWNDVLDAPFWGFTDSYTLLNATFGVKWADGKVTTSLKGTNLLNQDIQQHIFGDILRYSLALEVRVFVK